MVIKFSKHKNAYISNIEDQKYYIKQLSNIGSLKNKLSHLNLCFNNPDHGLSPQFVDIHDFLQDIQRAARSRVHTLEIHGSEHMDPSFRYTYLISTYDRYKSMPAQVRDTYITISFGLAANNTSSVSKFKSVISGMKYHLLVAYPHVNQDTNLGFIYSTC